MYINARPNLLLVALIALGGCGGGDDSESPSPITPPVPPSAAAYRVDLILDSAEPAMGRVIQPNGTVSTYLGDRDENGMPARIREITYGGQSADPAFDSRVVYDEMGRIEYVFVPGHGSLSLEHFSTGAARITWRDPVGDRADEYEVFVPSYPSSTAAVPARSTPSTPAALQYHTRAIPSPLFGEVEIQCNRNGVVGPYDGALPEILRREHNAPDGNLDNRAWYNQTGVKRVAPGLYQYPLRSLGRNAPAALYPDEMLRLMNGRCASNNIQAEALFEIMTDLLPTKLEDWKKDRLKEVVVAIVKVVKEACGVVPAVDKIFENAVYRLLETARIDINRTSMSAQARNALHASPKVAWDYLPNATSVPKQVLVMPSAACPLVPLAGTWSGSISQPENPVVSNFTYSVSLAQTDTALSGTGTIEVAGSPQYVGVHSISGLVSNNTVVIRDGSLSVNRPYPGLPWCTKTSNLTFRRLNQADRLTGTFTAPNNCKPGYVSLTR